MNHRIDQSAVIAALRGASPYIRLYKGKIFVIKAGGAIFGDLAGTRSLIEQIAILHHLGIRVVLVHGGGPQLDQMQRSLGIEPRMVRGRRVTDDRSIDATVIRKELEAGLMPVVSPVSADDAGTVLNINADTVAAAIGAALEAAIRGGVRRVHVISYNARDSILAEVFTNEGTGSMIVADVKALTPAEQHPEGDSKT